MKNIKSICVLVLLAFATLGAGCKQEDSDSNTSMAFLLAAAFYAGRPIVMINMGDSLTNGDQSGATHEFSQALAFPQLLANQMQLRGDLPFYNPLLNATGGSAGQRQAAQTVPYNLGVNGHTVKTLKDATATAGGTNHIDKILAPIPEIRGAATTQLEAAEYVATLNPDRALIITLWIGGNDVLGAVTASSGAALTAASINTFLNDAAAGHDLASVQANLNAIVDRLRVLPNAQIFLGTLPDISGIGFLVTQSDLQKLAHTSDTLNITNFGSCEALGFAALIGTGAADSLMNHLDSNNATLNAVVGGYAGNDGTCLTAAEAAPITTRVGEINAHIRALAAANANVHLVDVHAMFEQIQSGQVTVGGKTLGKTLGHGGIFSFDGVHPSATGHALLANLFIGAINGALFLNIPAVDVASVQAADPYRDVDGDGFAVGPDTAVSPVSAALTRFKDCDDNNTAKYAQIVHGGGGAAAGTCP